MVYVDEHNVDQNIRGTTVMMVYERRYGDALFRAAMLISISLFTLFWALYLAAVLMGMAKISFVIITLSAIFLAVLLIPILLFMANNISYLRR